MSWQCIKLFGLNKFFPLGSVEASVQTTTAPVTTQSAQPVTTQSALPVTTPATQLAVPFVTQRNSDMTVQQLRLIRVARFTPGFIGVNAIISETGNAGQNSAISYEDSGETSSVQEHMENHIQHAASNHHPNVLDNQ